MKVKKFKDWKLVSKVMSVSVITVGLMLSGFFFYVLPRVETQMRDEHMESVQNVVDVAYNLIAQYGKRVETGEFGLEDARKRAAERVKSLRYQEKNYLWINDLGPMMVMHPMKPELDGKDMSENKDPNGKYLFRAFVEVCKRDGAGFVDYMWPKPGKAEPMPKTSYVRLFAPWGWIVGSGIYLDQMEAEIAGIRWSVIVVLAVCAIAAISLAFLISRKITGNLSNGVVFAERLAQGDLSQQLDIDQKDEIGVLAGSLNKTVSSLARMFKDITSGVDTLTSSSTELLSISQQMSSGAEQTTGKSNTVAGAAEEMSSNMNSVAAAVEEASTNIGMVATATEEMTATINEIAQNSEKARSIAGGAVSDAGSASEKVNELGRAAQEIGKVTETITEISEQTNLLALNATIEAARAGEAGKGFAVVANEIKDLARQTAEATQEIKGRIEGIQASTAGTVTTIEQISKVINDVNEIVSTIATAVEEQSVTTREIATNVSQASEGIAEVTENVAQSSTVAGEIAGDIADVNQSSNEMSNSSSQVSMSAEELSGLAGQLKEMVGQFRV